MWDNIKKTGFKRAVKKARRQHSEKRFDDGPGTGQGRDFANPNEAKGKRGGLGGNTTRLKIQSGGIPRRKEEGGGMKTFFGPW